MARRLRKTRLGRAVGTLLTLLLLVPFAYLTAALVGSLVPANGKWREPAEGTTVYIADNGIHTDILLPVDAGGLDWKAVLPVRDGQSMPPGATWIALGAGDEQIYLDTPSWWDLKPRTLWSALAGGRAVIHAEYVTDPSYAAREIRLRPEEYRRLWAALRASFLLDSSGRPRRINHPGYGAHDAFYEANGKASIIRTCNSWLAGRLRLAGVKASIWPPFAPGLIWRYRRPRARSD